MRLLLDTNRLTDLLRGDAEVVEIVERAAEVFVPFVTLAEIKSGFQGGKVRLQVHNEALLANFLVLPGVSAIYADRETTEVYARLYAQLRKAGTPVPTNDLWIASLAVQHSLSLFTRDRHFHRIPQVSLMV
jgi:tRNA(fMet)-specific endonuclease VapC